MHSKWIDVGIDLAAFHLQSVKYAEKKPPAFGSHPHLQFVERERERNQEMTYEELQEQLDEACPDEGIKKFLTSLSNAIVPGARNRRRRKGTRGCDGGDNAGDDNNNLPSGHENVLPSRSRAVQYHKKSIIGNYEQQSTYKPLVKRRGTISSPQGSAKLTSRRPASMLWKEENHPLFLEECAHLLSLLSGVALSTLRNDLETASSPLITFVPGVPFPHVDPDDYKADVRKGWTETTHRTITVFLYLFGQSRNSTSRTLYNASRPFRIIGGVSDTEIELLQAARGPLAKVALCSLWLQEFVTRECLAGSVGSVAPPILSRLYQFISDGMLGYNQARKVAYIPFPFPHAQITSLFVFAVAMFLPVLMLQFVANIYLAFFLNFVTVMSFTGLHEVARELEQPFMNVPNDVPLNNFQAQFNEALMTMFTGYHPDSYWEVNDVETSAHEVQ